MRRRSWPSSSAGAATVARVRSALLHPTVDSWPTYHGDYSGQHHSALTQITPANVHQLTLAWAFQTNITQLIKATPILVNGVDLPHDARQHVGDRRAIGPADLALHLSGERRVPDRPSRRRGATGDLGLPDDARRAPGRARRAHRHRCDGTSRSPTRGAATGRPTRRSIIRNHLHRRCVGRLRQSARHPQVVRSRNRRAAVDVLQHAAARHAGLDRAAARPAGRCG